MKRVLLAATMIGVSMSFSTPGSSETPTTKVLAIGNVAAGTDPQLLQRLLPTEVQATVQLYLQGKIDQWYSQQQHAGVVFVMNVSNEGEARALLEGLPLGRAHLMTFQLVPLGPLTPLRRLLPQQ